MEIINKNNFKSLISKKNYNINKIIHKLSGNILSKPTRTSIEIEKNKHIEDDYGKYMNHSFIPNCKINNGNIVAIKKINKGDELTFNYNENETKMCCPFIDHNTKQKVNGKN